jgi:hypothetical protein
MRRAAMSWRVASFLCLGAGCYQAHEVAERVRHLTTIAWKMGMDSFALITAGVVMIVVFFLFTGVFVALGLITTDHFLRQRSWFSLPAILGTEILIAGAIIWGAMLASPYVEIVNR